MASTSPCATRASRWRQPRSGTDTCSRRCASAAGRWAASSRATSSTWASTPPATGPLRRCSPSRRSKARTWPIAMPWTSCPSGWSTCASTTATRRWPATSWPRPASARRWPSRAAGACSCAPAAPSSWCGSWSRRPATTRRRRRATASSRSSAARRSRRSAGGRRVQQRHGALPARAQHLDQRRRGDDHRALAHGARDALAVARRRPRQQLVAAYEPRRAVAQDEGAVGQVVEHGFVVALGAGALGDALAVQLRVDRVGADLAAVQLAPQRDEAVVVLAPAQRACAVPGGHRRRLVEEEQLREAAGLEQRRAVPAAKAQPARDPAPARVATADLPGVVVQAAAVAVDQPARRIGDQLAEWRDPVAPRHDQRAAGVLSKLPDRLAVDGHLASHALAGRGGHDADVVDDQARVDDRAAELLVVLQRGALLGAAVGHEETAEVAAVRVEQRDVQALDPPVGLHPPEHRDELVEHRDGAFLPPSDRGPEPDEQCAIGHQRSLL